VTKATGWTTVQSQKVTNSLASLAHYGYRQRYGGEEDSWGVMPRLQVDEVGEGVEEPEIARSLATIVMYWLQSSRISEG
jgi:hypothetical protein